VLATQCGRAAAPVSFSGSSSGRGLGESMRQGIPVHQVRGDSFHHEERAGGTLLGEEVQEAASGGGEAEAEELATRNKYKDLIKVKSY